MFFYSSIFITFSICFYFLLRPFTSRLIALIILFTLITSNSLVEHSFMAYTNLPYAIYLTLGILFSLHYFIKPRVESLILALLFVGGSMWIRDAEPFWIVVPAILSISIFKNKNWKLFLLLLPALILFYAPWSIYKSNILKDKTFVSSTITILDGIHLINFRYFFDLFIYMWKYFFLPYIFIHILNLLESIRTIFYTKNKNSLITMCVIISIYLLIGAGSVYMSLTYPKWLRVGGSLERMSLLLIPITLYFIGIGIKIDRKKNEN